MRVPLSEFEQYVRPEPLERGLSLYERGQVESIRNLGKGQLEAVVQDADGTWHPTLQIKDEAIVAAKCACPQAGDDLCKHAIALVFAMEAGQFKEGVATRTGKVPKEKAAAKGRGRPKLDEDPEKPKAAKAAKPPKPPKPPKTAADIIARVPHEELVAFLLQEIKLDKNIEVRLKAHFADLLPATTPAEVEKRIQEAFSASVGKSGRMNKGAMILLVKRLDEWANEANRYVANQHYDLAFAACRIVSEILLNLNHESYAPIEEIKVALKKTQVVFDALCIAEMDNAMRQEIFDKILALTRSYNARPNLVRLAACICKTETELQLVEKMLGNDPEDENATQVRWEMLRRVKGAAAAAEYEKKHGSHKFFVLRQIDDMRKRGDLKSAIKLAMKGFDRSQHQPTKLGFWGHLTDDLMQAVNDVDGRIGLCIKLYRWGYRTDRLHLQQVLKLGGPERWRKERDQLMQERDPKKYQHHDAIISLYEVDHDWEGFAKLLSEFSPSQILAWSPVLMRRKRELYWEIVVKALNRILVPKANPKDQTFLALLRELVRMKGKEAAAAEIEKIHTANPQNVALAEIVRNLQTLMRHMSIGYY